ncbi:MAG: acetyl-CoA carboxylase, carboxyltransferase subunit beta [Bacteroidota bacterium]
MSWYNRIAKGITTRTKEKKETKEGLWHKCSSCKKIRPAKEHNSNCFVCLDCGYHERINSKEYFEILFDNNEFSELFANLSPADPLHFEDTKKYADRIIDSQEKTGMKDALCSAVGKTNGHEIVICCMDFLFIGGSMGSVVGEKISRSIDYCIETKTPLLIISKSGGARMMESSYSLMQMAKTAAKLTLLSEAKIPYISLMTDPTTGGVTASYAMLGDLNIAEPESLIGFAGPRVIKETIKKDLPKGFQTAEFLLEYGFLDMIVNRKELKEKLAQLLTYFKN